MSDATERHSAGGKSSFRLPDGMRGTAVFSGERDEYRTLLTRHWGEAETAYALWCGMNPSTAEANINDMTIVKGTEFTRRLGLQNYWMMNVADYRATDPAKLLALGSRVRSPGNLQTIRDAAAQAEIIIMSHGSLHRDLVYLGRETAKALIKDGRKLWCLGKTADGSPKHPSRLAYATGLVRFQ